MPVPRTTYLITLFALGMVHRLNETDLTDFPEPAGNDFDVRS